MKTKTKTKPKYRMLRADETLREGDEYESAIGWLTTCAAGEPAVWGGTYRRKVKARKG